MNKIDFALVISAEKCNPNGDPLTNNRPRQDYDGYGYISSVCLKHKIRNRFLDFGERVLIVEDSRVTDGLYSIRARVKAEKVLSECKGPEDTKKFIEEACKIWIDVRTFGQVFAYKNLPAGASIPVRGPVSIGQATSLDIVNITDFTVTKGTNTNSDAPNQGQKDSTTFHAGKSMVSHAAYAAYGSIFPQLADKTGFSDSDAELLKNALATIFENDASSARPSGSMGSQLFWWEHDCPVGRKNSLYVHHSLHLTPKDTFPFYDYEVDDPVRGIKLTIL